MFSMTPATGRVPIALTWPPGSTKTASGRKARRRGNPQPGVRRLEERHILEPVSLRRKDLTVSLIVVRP